MTERKKQKEISVGFDLTIRHRGLPPLGQMFKTLVERIRRLFE